MEIFLVSAVQDGSHSAAKSGGFPRNSVYSEKLLILKPSEHLEGF